jgi:hypothetical protein
LIQPQSAPRTAKQRKENPLRFNPIFKFSNLQIIMHLIVYTTVKKKPGRPNKHTDHILRVETDEEARKKYDELLKKDGVYYAAIGIEYIATDPLSH